MIDLKSKEITVVTKEDVIEVAEQIKSSCSYLEDGKEAWEESGAAHQLQDMLFVACLRAIAKGQDPVGIAEEALKVFEFKFPRWFE